MAGDSPAGYSLAGQSGLIVFDIERDPGTGAWSRAAQRESGAVDRRRQAQAAGLFRGSCTGAPAAATRVRSARAGARCRVPVRVYRVAPDHVPRARCADMAVSTTWAAARSGAPRLLRVLIMFYSGSIMCVGYWTFVPHKDHPRPRPRVPRARVNPPLAMAARSAASARSSTKLRIMLRRLRFGMTSLLSSLAPVYGEVSLVWNHSEMAARS